MRTNDEDKPNGLIFLTTKVYVIKIPPYSYEGIIYIDKTLYSYFWAASSASSISFIYVA
jgi:hypothetical protein